MRGEWVLVHHRSEALDELDVSILGLAAPLAFEVRATVMCRTTPSDEELLALVRCATQTPNQGDAGIPARIVVESDEFVPRLRAALPGVAIQAHAGIAEDALMPTLLEAADDITELLEDSSEDLSDRQKDFLSAVEAILDDETADFLEALGDEDDEDDELSVGPSFGDTPFDPAMREAETDPTSSEVRSAAPTASRDRVDADTEARVVLAFKTEHYGSWPDLPVPALDGKTPRAAAKSAELRPRLARLLDDMTADEARAPAAHRFDFSSLRRELGM